MALHKPDKFLASLSWCKTQAKLYLAAINGNKSKTSIFLYKYFSVFGKSNLNHKLEFDNITIEIEMLFRKNIDKIQICSGFFPIPTPLK